MRGNEMACRLFGLETTWKVTCVCGWEDNGINISDISCGNENEVLLLQISRRRRKQRVVTLAASLSLN
jgi:hypothetical protein